MGKIDRQRKIEGEKTAAPPRKDATRDSGFPISLNLSR